jgi:hypothetical protein
MKKLALSLLILVGTLTAQAERLRVGEQSSGMDYTYLTFETTDGAKTSVDVSSLPVTINLNNSTLTIGNQTFALADLNKMYFSMQSVTTGIEEISSATINDDAVIYDLHGRRVTKAQMRRGIYVVNTKQGTRKVSVR